MQIATMTTFPGPCMNVVLLPDRGFREKKNRTKQHILKVIQWLEGLQLHLKSALLDTIKIVCLSFLWIAEIEKVTFDSARVQLEMSCRVAQPSIEYAMTYQKSVQR